MKITKIEAAKNQLNIAIHLFFSDYDLISTHTLSAAARWILYDLAKKENISPNLWVIKKWYRQSYEIFIRKAQNFFKHAGERDDSKNTSFDLQEDMTEMLLYEAITLYLALSWELTTHMKLFKSFYFLKNYEKIESEKIKEIITNQKKDFWNKIPDKKEFYEKMLKN